MPCLCGRNNIETIITKKEVVTQNLFHQKTKDDQVKILKNYINSKPTHVKNDKEFQNNMVKLYKSIVSA